MDHEGLKSSLVSREVVFDLVGPTANGERFEGLLPIAGCDKSLLGTREILEVRGAVVREDSEIRLALGPTADSLAARIG